MIALTAMSLEATMIWFVVTTVLVVLVIGGGMVVALRSYDTGRRHQHHH